MKDKNIKKDKIKKDDRNKKPHYKKQQSGVYNKKKAAGKVKNKTVDSKIKQLALQAQAAEPAEELVTDSAVEQAEMPASQVVAEPVEVSVTKEADVPVTDAADVPVTDAAEKPEESVVTQAPTEQPKPVKQAKSQAPKKQRATLPFAVKLLIQTVLAAMCVMIGAVLLLSTMLLVYRPLKRSNDALDDQRLQNRMELSAMIADVFPGMNVDDQLSDVVLRALENKKNTLRNESGTVAKEIEVLRTDNEDIAKLMADTGYDTISFSQIVNDAYSTERCLQAMNGTVSVIDHKLETLGVAKLKEEIASLKGTTTTVTKEDENGETVTETVTVGGLIPEAQAKKAELQKKYDELQGKLDELDAYLDKNNGRITAMFNRLDGDQKANNVFDKMEAITAYVKASPKNNIFVQDTEQKLGSFPGESKEEDDILFIMKVEAETGIHMQMVNYGQDYQHKQLSNGMLLCYEVYSIPYYASYEGLKNLIAYFSDNDDFYASVYTLSIQYNPANESIQGNMVILHYYLLDKNAEYVPPIINEEIIPGIDGIFGDVTDSGKTEGKQSPYTAEDVKSWLDDGMTFEQVRDKLKFEGYPATEFAWIMKEDYKTPGDMQEFLEEYGEEDVEYDLDYVLDLLECDLKTLMDIYYSEDPEDTTGDDNTPEDPEDTTDDDNTPDDPEDTTGDDNTPDDPEDTTGDDNTPDDPEDTTGDDNTPDDPEDTTGDNTPDDPEDTTGGNDKPNKPTTGKQSDYTAEDIEDLMYNQDMSLEEVRDWLVDQGYPAIELAWILSEKYHTEADIVAFMMVHGELDNYRSLSDATELFDCKLSDLKKIYSGR